MPKQETNINNRKARFDYEFLETCVAGLVLTGVEAKGIRAGHVSLADAYCIFHQRELWTNNLQINVEGASSKIKLLLTRKELRRLEKSLQPGLTIVVSRIFAKNGRFKAEIALARGKRNYDKRQNIKARDVQREMQRNENC